MSESNLAYNNDGSMNTSADYLGKFLQYIYNDFAIVMANHWPPTSQIRSTGVILGHTKSLKVKSSTKNLLNLIILRFIVSNCNQNFHFLTLTDLV